MKSSLSITAASLALAGAAVAADPAAPRSKPGPPAAPPPLGAAASAPPPAKATPAAAPAKSTPPAAAPASPAPKPPQTTTTPAVNALTSAAAKEAPPSPPVAEAGQPAANRRPPLITTDISGRDLQFLTQAMENGLVQLYLGELAREKAEAEQVKKVADLLSATQEEENKRLMRLASMKGINLSVAQSSAKKTVDARLGKLSGPKFDKTLLEELVAANQRAVATYEAATSTQDQEIRSYAEQGLPLAKEKLLIANKMTGNPMRTHRAPAPEPAAAGTPASSSGSRP